MPGWKLAVWCALMMLCAWVVSYSWFRILTIWIPFGLPPRILSWAVAAIGGVTLLVGLSAWRIRQAPAPIQFGRWTWGLIAAWLTLGASIWYALSSPLSRDASIAVGFSVTSAWLLWAWLMFFVSWRWLSRLAVLAALLALVGVFVVGIQNTGWDGRGRAIVEWRRASTVGAPALGAELSGSLPDDDESAHDKVSEYPRFRGADGLATVRGAKLARDWSRTQPRPIWRHPVGAGWSGLVVAADRAITQEQRNEDECVVGYDRHTGKQRWVHGDRAHYVNAGAGDGPRATPTIHGDRVFALGATGILNCLDRDTGKRHWTVNILTDNEATAPGHGTVGSPLVVGERVVVCAGGTQGASLVAYDQVTGRRVWRGGNDPAGYASPLLLPIDGVPQILIVTTQNLNAHDPQTGEVLWTTPWRNDQQTNCSQPFPIGDKQVFISADYGTGCALLNLARGADGKWAVETAWSNRAMQTKFCSVVVHDGHAYSFDDEVLECVAVADGRRRWKAGRYGHGQLLLADDLLVIQAEDGRVALVEATSQGHHELGQFQALNGKTWNNPSLAGHQLFVRNDQEAACYELPVDDAEER